MNPIYILLNIFSTFKYCFHSSDEYHGDLFQAESWLLNDVPGTILKQADSSRTNPIFYYNMEAAFREILKIACKAF